MWFRDRIPNTNEISNVMGICRSKDSKMFGKFKHDWYKFPIFAAPRIGSRVQRRKPANWPEDSPEECIAL
jgi:hypothetical protein